VKITPNQVFLDDVDRFEPGQEYDVDPDRGLRLVGLGWATSPDVTWTGPVSATTLPANHVVLQPDDVVTGHAADEV
jgi:hypothetical protein